MAWTTRLRSSLVPLNLLVEVCGQLCLLFTQVVCDLIDEEAELLGGSEHVMLAGFSQGGALALHIAVHSGMQ